MKTKTQAVELSTPPSEPVWWRVAWYTMPGRNTTTPKSPIRAKAKTWFEARAAVQTHLPPEAQYVELVQE